MTTSEEKEKKRVYDKQYYQENKEKWESRYLSHIDEKKAYDKEYFQKNKTKRKVQNIKWCEENPHRAWAIDTIKHHKYKEYDIQVDIDGLTEYAKKTVVCEICNCELNWSYGTKGGKCKRNSPTWDRSNNGQIMRLDNTQILCLSCNSKKDTTKLNDYIQNS